MDRIALFLPNWLGDVVMATPALRALRERFATSEILGIVRPNLIPVFDGSDWLSDVWPFNPRSDDKALGRWSLIKSLRRRRIDMAVLFTNSLHTAALAWLGGAKRRLGYARGGRSWLLTDRLTPARDGKRFRPQPMVEYYLALAVALGCEAASPALCLPLTDAEVSLGAHVWQRLGLRHKRVVAMNPSGAYGSAKHWPTEHFARLAGAVAARLDHDVLVFCGPKERDIARQIVAQANHPRVFSMADQPMGLDTMKGTLAGCRLMVSTDSGPRHLAAGLGKPVVTLFGPIDPVWSYNATVTAVDLQVNVACAPCGKRNCPLPDHPCMRGIAPEMVFDEVARLVRHDRQAAA